MPSSSRKQKWIRWLLFWSFVAAGFFGGRHFLRLLYPVHYSAEVAHYAAVNNLDPLLVHAVIRVESGYNPRALSHKGARGLMQLMPETARWVASHDDTSNVFDESLLYDPEINVRLGTRYLRDLMDEFDGRLVVALAAYNAGRGNVSKWLSTQTWDGRVEGVDRIPFVETRNYIQRVFSSFEWYQRLYSD